MRVGRYPGGTISEGGWARCTQAIRQAPPNCRLGGSQGCDWYGPEGSCDVRRGPLWRPPTHHPPAHVPLLVFLVTHGTGAFYSCFIAMHLQPKLGSQGYCSAVSGVGDHEGLSQRVSLWFKPSMREFKGRAGFLSSCEGIIGMNTGGGLGLGFWQQIPIPGH